VSLVGYTNAGKSTLLNALTDAGVLVADRLFATLDPRTRKLVLPGGQQIVCSDTVGFVRKLPHQLVESFHSTLEEVSEADLLIHVVDASASNPEAQMEAVRAVLHEIDADGVPELLAFNKADRAPQEAARLAENYPGSVLLSAARRTGIDELLTRASEELRRRDSLVALVVPFDRGDVLAGLHRAGEVLSEVADGGAFCIQARLSGEALLRFAEFIDGSETPSLESGGAR